MRSPVYSNALAAAGTATWGTSGAFILPVSYIQPTFGVALGGILSEDASGITYTYTVTYDDCSSDSLVPITASQTTTAITVTDPALPLKGGVVAADVVRIIGLKANVDGWYVVATTPSTTTYTVTSTVSQTVASTPCYHQYFRLFATPAAITGASTRIAATIYYGNVGPVTGVCLKAGARAAGSLTGVVVQGVGSG
jgi:hypothetical protein